ncbi:Dipeptidyl-peptidase III [Histomonas meleagridis]|nr:Dipeptidyl-peptidase III [Histomonas meleagridis]
MASFLCPTDFPVGDLKTGKYLKGLSEKERKYATYLVLASWAGFPILADQTSRESPRILKFLLAFFQAIPREALIQSLNEKTSVLYYIVEYAAQFFYQGGNFLGFGDTKFIPRCSKEDFILATPESIRPLLLDCIEEIYSTSPDNVTEIGFHPTGVNTYYEPSDFTEEEAKGIDSVLTSNKIKLETTKIIRHDDRYEVQLPSIEIDTTGKQIGEYKGKPIYITKGRYSSILKGVVYWLNESLKHCSNNEEKLMLESLILHYQKGDCDDHVRYSEHWVRDLNPNVETYSGFIESYRDPDGVRAEFESFVACVDKEESSILHEFVNSSALVLPLLPYPKEYERKTFNPPSYNAINILTFVCSGYPIGINIPNYDEIRLNVGFKNVSLTNVMTASLRQVTSFPFLYEDDAKLLCDFFDEMDNFATAAHELYGHGSGTLFKEEDVKGKNIPDMFNEGKFIDTYYEENQTAEQTFGSIYSSFEECRAETTSVYLAFFPEILNIFKINPENEYRKNFEYTSVLSMLHAGAKTLICYSPESKQWKQAHARARFAILKAAIKWSNGAVVVEELNDEKCKYKIKIDKSRLNLVKDAMEILLKHLNYYRTTNKAELGCKFFEELTEVDEFWLKVREVAIKQKQNRPVYVGVRVVKNGNEYNIEQPCENAPNVVDALITSVENLSLSLVNE